MSDWGQRGMFDEVEVATSAAELDEALERWLGEGAAPPAGECARCGVALQPHETTDCDDCRREAMVRQRERTERAYEKGIARGKKPGPAVGKPQWTDNAGEPPDRAAMPTALRQAFARQMKRHGDATLYCEICRLPTGRFDVCYPCRLNPKRQPGRCDSCGVNCRAEYLTCWDCKNEGRD